MAKDKDKPGRIKQFAESYRITKQADPKIGLILLGVFLFAGLVGFALFSLLPGALPFDIVTGVFVGILGALVVFGRRATRAGYASIEGRPGAAVAALQMLRRGWKVDQAIAFNKNQDIVHRVVGRPGIILVGEGNANRLKPLLAAERRKHERVASETPIQEIIVGSGVGEVALPKLARHITKMKGGIKPAQMTDVLARLRALDAQRGTVPIPKGPVPTSMKGQRGNLRGR